MTRWSLRARAAGKRIGFVPTMGALHEGHLSLVRAASRQCDRVLVSIFVNPLQFGPKEDFARYPRNPKRDAKLTRSAGADVVFAPKSQDMYPAGFCTRVDVQSLGSIAEGRIRPGHFQGVATVVMKLLHIAQPDVLYLGQKDFQQAVLLKKLVEDLSIPVKVKVLPTVREPNGLAMSSRNAYLSAESRARAGAIYQALRSGKEQLLAQPQRAWKAAQVMSNILQDARLDVDYAYAADPRTLVPIRAAKGPTMLLVAARLSGVRLIDNLLVDVP